jgi:hypothetical protein
VLEIQPNWVLEPEALGTKEKFWCRGTDKADWLFKKPRPNTGEHWAEKIAAEIATLMKVRHAQVELAVFDGTRGSASKSFVDRSKGFGLVHGNEILAGHVTGYNPQRRMRQADHTFANILTAITRAFGGTLPPQELATLADYLVFDAVIGNTDRHHENWAFLVWRRKEKQYATLAPSFDHATSLGRELLDDGPRATCRRRILAEDRTGAYAEGGHGAIYWESADRHGVGPLELVRRAVRLHPEPFRAAIAKSCALDQAAIEAIIAQVPQAWMTPLAREFALDLVSHNLQQLRLLKP